MAQLTADPNDDQILRQNSKLIKDLVKETHFSLQEIEALSVIYSKFLTENDERRTQMERNQFRSICHKIFHIDDDFLFDRAFAYLENGIVSPNVSLATWIRTMSLFLRGTLEEKMTYCFAVYDINGDGQLKRNEVLKLLGKCFVCEHDEDAQLAAKDLADIMVRKMDLDTDGAISFDDYKRSVIKQPELLECFGRCLPERACAYAFQRTFTSEDIRF